jgi:hypothetical protein
VAGPLGVRDGAVTRDESLTMVRTIAAETHLQVWADLENGFGDGSEAAAATIHNAEAARKARGQGTFGSLDGCLTAKELGDFMPWRTATAERFILRA